jgi:hypothetical protein
MNVLFNNNNVTTSHNNLPEDTVWSELMELYLKHLNSAGYFVDEEMIETLVEVADDLCFKRFLEITYPE